MMGGEFSGPSRSVNPLTDRRRALVVAALAALRVKSREPELVLVHAWLDSGPGLGAGVVGRRRLGNPV